MNNYNTHFCLVSEQPIPNITPTLDKRFKPQKVVLLTSELMKYHADNLIKVYQNNDILYEILSISDAYDLLEITTIVDEYLSAHIDEDIALNITGGTKPMAIAAQEVFSIYEKDIFYINIKSDELMFLSRQSEKKITLFQIDDRIGLQDYLNGYGISILNNIENHRKIHPDYQQVMNELIVHSTERYYHDFISTLNYYAFKAKKTLMVSVDNQLLKYDQLLRLYIKSNLIQIDNFNLTFTSEKNRFFCNGGWLEDYTFLALRSLRQELKIQDITTGLKVGLKNGSTNELDVVFIANNRFYIIECKTKQYKGHKDGADDTIYKLDSLKYYGGIRTKAMLISYQQIRDVHKKRATDYEIAVVDQNNLSNLQRHLKKWILE